MKIDFTRKKNSVDLYISQFLQPLAGHDSPVLYMPIDIYKDQRWNDEWDYAIAEGEAEGEYDVLFVSEESDPDIYEANLVFSLPDVANEEPEEVKNPDMVNHPPHYQSKNELGMECIDIIKASMSPEEFHGYLKGCIIKYVFRSGYKWDSIEDLKKGSWYLTKMIEELKEDI